MSAFQEIVYSPLGILLRLIALLLLLGQVVLLTRAVRMRQGPGGTALSGIHLALGMAFLWVLLDGAYRLDYLPYVRQAPPFVRLFYGLPWQAIAGMEGADLLAQGLFAAGQYRFSRLHPSSQSIKNAVDLMPAGVCVSEADGTVLLSNVKMNQWNQLLTGGTLSDANVLLQTVKTAGQPQESKYLVALEDETALLFEESVLELDGKQYTQLTAEDVSEQYRVTRALKTENTRLREWQYRMKTYQFRETELLTRQEILNARATVHNQLGGALLTGKYHLEHPESTDPEALRQMLYQINTYLLAEADDPEPRTDAFSSAQSLAAGIGVSVHISGSVPPKGAFRDLLGHAIEECAANAVKHAGADRLTVSVGPDGFRIANNGAPPAREITPLGGLRSLQLAAEQAGGAMTLQSRPAFLLTVKLPQKTE